MSLIKLAKLNKEQESALDRYQDQQRHVSTGAGTLIGAVYGGIIGQALSGNPFMVAPGAVVGALAGAGIGGLGMNALVKKHQENQKALVASGKQFVVQ